MKLKRRVREIIAYVLVFAIIIGIMRQEGYAKAETQNDTTNAEYHSQECLIEYRTMGSWGNYANVNVSITNEGERKISLWELEFSYSSKIENIWNADVLSEGDGQLKIGAKTYNSVIEKGQTVSFGFTAHCESGQPEAPGQMTLTDEQSRKKAEQPEETPDRTETGEGGQSVLFPEKWKGLNYALFTSGENDLSLYTCRTNVIGDVHTNHSFYYQGTTLSLQGRLEAADRICLRTSSMENACRVTEQNEQAGLVRMPDITAELNEYVKENSESYESGKNFNSDSVFLKKPVYVNGDAAFHATRFRGQGVVYAKNSVTYNVGQIATYENARMFLASEQGDITLNGTDITLDAVLYAPNGCVTVNANNFHLNGRIIARQVCINGTTININAGDGDFDMLPFLLKPEVALTVSGNQKENRKIVIDVEELENTRYIIKENTVWEVTKDGEDAGDRFLVDGDASDEFHKECLFTEAGTYTVSVTVTTEKAETTVVRELVIEEDLAPVAGFELDTNYVQRNENGEGTVVVTDCSGSPDGDEIGNRFWYIYYDKNNDGVFSEDEKTLVSSANEEKLTYRVKQVGKYKVFLEMKETFDDTIPHLVDDRVYLRGNSAELAAEGCVFEVGNQAPSASLDIRKSRSADIVLTVGSAGREKQEIYRKKAEEMQKALEKEGVDARVDVAKSSVYTAKDKFAWKEYDHYNYRDRYLPMMEKHILYGEEDIRMMGYGEVPIKDFLYVADDDPGRKVFEFDLQKDNTNWHSMEGGGFLFNTTVSEETNTIQGFCILVCRDGLKLVKIDCRNLSAFRDGTYNYVQHAGRLLRTFPIADVQAEHHFRIEVNQNIISVWDGEKLVIDSFVLPDNNYGYGYGPIASHASHWCIQQSYFTFKNIVMRTEKGRSLADIVSGYDWRPGAAHYVLNLSEEELPELADEESSAAVAAALVKNNAVFAGIGNETNENQYRFLLNAAGTGGMFQTAGDVGTAMDEIQTLVADIALSKDDSIQKYVTTDEILSYRDFYQDAENDPVYEAEWTYEYDPSVFAGNPAGSGKVTKKEKEPLTVLEDAGAYAIWLRVKDNPAGENDALDEYRKWSEQAEAEKLLIAHRRPEASVEAVVSEDPTNKTTCIVKTEYHAEDADYPDDTRKGIRKENYYYKNIRDAEWTEGKMPNKIEIGQTYLVKYTVRDVYGEVSFPAAAVVRTSDLLSYQEIEDHTPPTVHILPDKLEIEPGETVTIDGYAEDDYGVEEFKMYWNGEQILSSFGMFYYTPGEEGTVTIRATAKDIGGNESEETVLIEVVDHSDRTAPTAKITSPQSGSDIGVNVQVKGTAKDETAFEKYTLSYREQGGEAYTTFATGTEEVEDDVLGTLDISGFAQGVYEILLTVEDKAGNQSWQSLLLYVEKREQTETFSYELRAAISGIVYREEEKRIDIYGTADGEGNLASYELRVKAEGSEDASVIASGTEEAEEKLLGSISTEELEAGNYELFLTVSDIRGNRAEATASFEYIIEKKEITVTVTEVINPEPVVPPAPSVSPVQTPTETPVPTRTPAPVETQKPTETPVPTRTPAPVETQKPTVTPVPTRTPAPVETQKPTETPVPTRTPAPVETQKPTVTPVPTRTPAPVETQKPTGTPAPVETQKPTETPAPTGLPDVGREELDDLLNRTFGLTLSQDIAYTGNQVTAYVTLPATVREDSVVIMMDGKTIARSARSVSFTKGKAGRVSITATGVNHKGEQVSDTKECTFYNANDRNFPVAAFDLPKGDAILTEPADITGSAYDAEELDYYTLEYRPEGTEDFIQIETSTVPKKNEKLGHLDTTMLPNGRYEVRLSVVDKGGNRNRITRKYVVEGNLKVGAMNIGFTDITANMGGTSVNVNRNYSSQNKTEGDFGFGWSLGVQGMTLSESTSLYSGYKLSVTGSWFAPGYSLNETKNHDIVVAYGDGTSDRFELTLTPNRRSLIPIHEVELGYRCVTNPKVKLEIDGDNTAIVQDTDLLLNDTGMYNKVKYRLTTAEGVTIYLSAKTGVTKMKDKYGNTVRVDRNGYHATDGKSITFLRDEKDRVIRATDPNGKAVSYTYDEAGDLVKVTDSADREVSFTYDKKHNLLSITDPMGIAVARNEYDDDGRLIASIDADGNRMEYDYDVEGRTQVVKDRLGNTTVYVYDDMGNILQKTDANGNTTKQTYDSSGNMLSRIDAMGNTTKYSYDGTGNITSVTDAVGNRLENSYREGNLITSMKCGDDEILINYDEQGSIEETTDLAGNTTEYDHDGNGNVTGIVDSIGRISTAKYDGNGNVVENTDSTGKRKTYTYDGAGNRLTQTEYRETENGTQELTTTYVYDTAGDLVQTVDPDGNTTAIERNEKGQMTASTDAQGRRTTYEYDSQGNVTRTVYADGTEETFVYDAEGHVTESVSRLGQKTTYGYDRAGNLLKSTDSRGNSTTYTYDKNYNVLSVTAPSGAVTTYTYDALNRNTSVTDADGNTTTFTYNKYSFLTGVTDAKGNQTSYEYNRAGNRIRTIYPDGSSVQSGYDKRGRTIWQEDAAGIRTEYTYDSADRLTGVQTAAGTTAYEYDANGNLSSVTDANGNTTTYGYDVEGRLVKTIQPDGSTSTNTYDSQGRLAESTDYNGATTTYKYDGQDRVTRETKKTRKTGEPPAIKTYAYDKYGRLAEVSAGDSTIRYSYNSCGELSEKSYENGQKLSCGYDSLGRKSHVTVSSGNGDTLDRTSFEYDRMDRITRVIAKDGTATVYTYDENGNRETATFANGVTVTYEYDALNRLLVQKTVDRTGELVAQYKYTTGRNGRRTRVSEEGKAGQGETTYTYDAAGRLAGEKTISVDAAGTETVTGYAYKYDSAGNRVSKTAETENGSAETRYTYNSRNQLVSEETGGRETLCSYDANGNLLNRSGEAVDETYGYDAYNRMVSYVADHGAKRETYAYDAEGVRRRKTSSDEKKETETVFISDTSGELSRTLAETDGSGKLLAAYTWGDTLLAQTRDGKTATYLYDGHGNVRGLLDGDGTLTDTYSYSAYGELTGRTGETENHFLYTGEYYDGMSGLYYLRARYMNPAAGAFTSMDTYQGDLYEPVTLHKYLYANADPVTYTDPSGMFSLPECNIASAIGAELYKNQNMVIGMAIVNGIGKSVMVGMHGGDAGEVTAAFLEGMVEGAATAMLFCAVAVITVTSMAAVFTSVMAADSIVSIVIAIRNVMDGDYMNALVNGAFAVVGIIGVCKWYGTSYRVDVSGNKGTITLRAKQDTGNYIETPYGKAFQNTTDEALKVKIYVESGGDLYRGGTLGRSKTTDAQFWATENPLTSGYADKYGVDFSELEYIVKGKLKSGQPYITRSAPSLGNKKGGGMEVVTPPNSVEFDYFFMIGK